MSDIKVLDDIAIIDGKEIKLLGASEDMGAGRNPRCCDKARHARGLRFCVCSFRSYCPDHGVQCNGSHD